MHQNNHTFQTTEDLKKKMPIARKSKTGKSYLTYLVSTVIFLRFLENWLYTQFNINLYIFYSLDKLQLLSILLWSCTDLPFFLSLVSVTMATVSNKFVWLYAIKENYIVTMRAGTSIFNSVWFLHIIAWSFIIVDIPVHAVTTRIKKG